jgi:hypothetical protein
MQDKTWYSILGLDAEPLFLQDDMLKWSMYSCLSATQAFWFQKKVIQTHLFSFEKGAHYSISNMGGKASNLKFNLGLYVILNKRLKTLAVSFKFIKFYTLDSFEIFCIET